MLPIKQASKSKRALLSSQFLFNNATTIFSITETSSYLPIPPFPTSCFAPLSRYCYYPTAQPISIQPTTFDYSTFGLNAKDVAQSFKKWFKHPNSGLLDLIFDILSRQDEVDEIALSQLGLRVTESLVLEVLNYGFLKGDIFSSLKFFDWAGHQCGFYHTRATYQAVFKILSKSKHMRVMLDYLDSYMRARLSSNDLFGFHSTLVMGYSLAGKPYFALQMFGRMRFQGLDLDACTYHVLLSSLVEENYFEAVDSIVSQISLRGFESHVTHFIVVKSLCKQKMLNEAESYLRQVILNGNSYCLGDAVQVLVDALCQKGNFDKGWQLIEEFRELDSVPMEPAYGTWLKNLVRVGKLDEAVKFMQLKKASESYVPDVFRYNVLLWRLLKENRLAESCDLLLEMMESGISPNRGTMNAALCFCCKAGMVDVALDLYNCKAEFGLSPSSVACNYLIVYLCKEGSIDEAYQVFRNSTQQGYFPGDRTLSILVDALFREGKLDAMKELTFVALEWNFWLSDSMYNKFISALCRARMLEDGYLIHRVFSRMNRVATKSTYSNLIHGFNKLHKLDIVAGLLIEMQDKGHMATRPLLRSVIHGLCGMENPEVQFRHLFDLLISHGQPNYQICNLFIDGAGHAQKPELAREVFEWMQINGIEPNLSTKVLMLQSYLKSERISDALNFFDAMGKRGEINKKLFNSMVVGLCKVNNVNNALSFLWDMRSSGVVPSVQCYEVLIQLLCKQRQYDIAISLLYDLLKTGRHVTSFIGNILLLHSFRNEKLYGAWIRAREMQYETYSYLSVLGHLIGAFSGHVRLNEQIDNLEEVIEQCFPLDVYTYNMLLRRLTMIKMEDACKLFYRICQKGYEPNRWTYDILVHGLFKHGKTDEARRLVDEMFRRGFDLTDGTKRLIG
ncbi:hypothetical protein JCGZ_11065 [Jatropha curcas]|uniref:Pentacotripeptide-repeat region of PRORP domain-containing protein n=1 Tax=Jatropha curcas TaxID=180498 RepID=A0A067KQE1_JATCU|nr:hypothetical protein JCGZ_11065 [Jatropha curcas]